MSARETALSVLTVYRKHGVWLDEALKRQIEHDGLDRRDAALVTRLCSSVVQNRMLLDYWIGLFLHSHAQPVVTDILRLAVCQIMLMDKIPEHAAVNEAVEQAKRHANPRAGGLVNAVLRNLLRQRQSLHLPEKLSDRYSHPAGLIMLLRENVGEELLIPLLECHNQPIPIYLQVNTLRIDSASLLEKLTAEGYTAQEHPWLDDCLLLGGGGIERSEAYREGLFYVQDPAAQLAVLAADLQPEQHVLDCCAAPGGKSFAAAIRMKDRGSLLSCDFFAYKVDRIRRGAERLGLKTITALPQDATIPREEWRGRFDAVLADVPCSGFGVIRKKPDIRYKELAPLERLPELQLKILDTQADYVKPGGVLLYSTCTVLRRENEEVVSAFLERHPEYGTEPFSLPNDVEAAQGMITLLPCVHDTDGFFICKLRRHA